MKIVESNFEFYCLPCYSERSQKPELACGRQVDNKEIFLCSMTSRLDIIVQSCSSRIEKYRKSDSCTAHEIISPTFLISLLAWAKWPSQESTNWFGNQKVTSKVINPIDDDLIEKYARLRETPHTLISCEKLIYYIIKTKKKRTSELEVVGSITEFDHSRPYKA